MTQDKIKVTVKVDNSALLYGLAALTFTVLKLTAVIDWSWWWVLLPLWIVPAAMLALVIVWLAAVGLVKLVKIIAHGVRYAVSPKYRTRVKIRKSLNKALRVSLGSLIENDPHLRRVRKEL